MVVVKKKNLKKRKTKTKKSIQRRKRTKVRVTKTKEQQQQPLVLIEENKEPAPAQPSPVPRKKNWKKYALLTAAALGAVGTGAYLYNKRKNKLNGEDHSEEIKEIKNKSDNELYNILMDYKKSDEHLKLNKILVLFKNDERINKIYSKVERDYNLLREKYQEEQQRQVEKQQQQVEKHRSIKTLENRLSNLLSRRKKPNAINNERTRKEIDRELLEIKQKLSKLGREGIRLPEGIYSFGKRRIKLNLRILLRDYKRL